MFLSAGLAWFPEETFLGFLGANFVAWKVGIAWSPFLISAGVLIGVRVGLGFLAGAIVLFIMAPYVPSPRPDLYIWPGVLFLVTSGITTLLLNWRIIGKALGSIFKMGGTDSDPAMDHVMSPRTYKILLAVVMVVITGLLWMTFDIVPYLTAAMIIFGALIFNIIATRAYGETTFNPVRVMGTMLQGVCAMFGGANAATNLAGAGFAAGTIGQSSILVNDNVFGRHFKIPARWQWLAQFAVIVPIALISAYVYSKVTAAYPLSLEGDTGLSAPVAKMWATMAFVFSGQKEMPAGAVEAMWIGGIAGIIYALIDAFAKKRITTMALLEKKSLWRFFPHTVGLGIGLIIKIHYSLTFFLGAILLCVVVPKIFKTSEDTLPSIGAAGIVGEGVMGLIVAILIGAGVLG